MMQCKPKNERFSPASRNEQGSLVETAVEEQSLTAEDQLLILMQAAPYLTATRGLGASEARICLCRSLGRLFLL